MATGTIYTLLCLAFIRTLKGHTESVYSVALVNAEVLASGSDDKTIKLWEWATGREIRTLEGHTSYVMSVALVNEEVLASGSADNTGVKTAIISGCGCIASFCLCKLCCNNKYGDKIRQSAVEVRASQVSNWAINPAMDKQSSDQEGKTDSVRLELSTSIREIRT